MTKLSPGTRAATLNALEAAGLVEGEDWQWITYHYESKLFWLSRREAIELFDLDHDGLSDIGRELCALGLRVDDYGMGYVYYHPEPPCCPAPRPDHHHRRTDRWTERL